MISNTVLPKGAEREVIKVKDVKFIVCITICLLCFPIIANGSDVPIASVQTRLSERIEMAKEAGIQQDVLLLVTQEVLDKKLDGESAVCILNIALAAKNSKLPASVFEEKIREGSAKRIQGERICMALKSLFKEMEFSKQLLAQYTNKTPSESEIRTMHEAFSQGATHAQAEAFLSSHHSKKIKTALAAFSLYSLLKQSGVSSSQLNEFITLVMKDDAVMSRWKELPQLFAIVTRGGVAPDDFMEKATQAVKKGTSPHKFARELSLRPRLLGVSEEK
ncbi:hypothetical protein SAMN05660830_00746 [Halodesulfovibrio aestuarii]|uniref:Uncharacterized protein n=2 Tax=Halodesulfovibrio aestuarii TaxID=126333 RepID=A0A8G2C7W1_9BACT|nr:hypothetical protein SAMN05660830_00746 [Halodesulfovibrio aestuarii]